MTDVTIPSTLSGYRATDVGVLAHALVATVLPDLPHLPAHLLPQALMIAAGRLVSGENVNRRRTLVATATGHAATYLRRASLVEPWALLGCEWRVEGGRVDVAWRHRDGHVLFDEFKTSNQAQRTLPDEWVEQVRRYAQAGAALHGDTFLGVRLVPCGSLNLATVVRPDGTLFPLQELTDLSQVPS